MRKIITLIVLFFFPLFCLSLSNEIDLSHSIQDNHEFTNFKNNDVVSIIVSTSNIDILLSNLNNMEVLITDEYNTLFNGVSLKTKYSNIDKIKNIKEVENVIISEVYKSPEIYLDNSNTNTYSNDLDFKGEGTLVGVIDTGFNVEHSIFQTELTDVKLFKEDIKNIYLNTNAYLNDTSNNENDFYYNSKIPFRFDYYDNDNNVITKDNSGQHQASVIAADNNMLSGVSSKAQLALMKIYSDDGYTNTSTFIKALEDAVVLGVDVINLTLGDSLGFSNKSNIDFYESIFNSIEQMGITVCSSIQNASTEPFYGNDDNLPNANNPDYGIPNSIDNLSSINVASANTTETYHILGEEEIYFNELNSSGNFYYNFMNNIKATNEITSYEYVVIPNNGEYNDYSNIDIKNKIAIVNNLGISILNKINIAKDRGAKAILIYNDEPGNFTATVGYGVTFPAATISKETADKLIVNKTGVLKISLQYQNTHRMQEYSHSSNSLQLNTDVTSIGSSIYSSTIDGYSNITSYTTSVSTISGITASVRGYIQNKFPHLNKVEVCNMTTQLLMSTTTILNDENGNPYSVRRQGAGFTEILNALTSEAYLNVSNQTKSKIELYDDPNKTGIYEFSFNLNNISNSSKIYELKTIVMTESISNNINELGNYTFLQKSYILNSKVSYFVNGTSVNSITVSSNSSISIDVKIELSNNDIKYLEKFENGIFVEGFVQAINSDVSLSIPFLGFYGDWTEAPIFDSSIYDNENADVIDSYILGKNNSKEYVMGSYMFDYDETIYGEIHTSNKITFNNINTTIDSIYLSLLRDAKKLTIEVVDVLTNEVIYTEIEYDCRKVYVDLLDRDKPVVLFNCFSDFKLQDLNLSNNTEYKIIMKASLDYSDNVNDELVFNFAVDIEAPNILEYDIYTLENKTYIDLVIYDNNYAQALFLGYYNNGFISFSKNSIPILNKKGENHFITIDITSYLPKIAINNNKLAISLYDYALNNSIVEIEIPNIEYPEFELQKEEVFLNKHDYVLFEDLIYNYDIFYNDIISIESLNTEVCFVDTDKIIAVAGGETIVKMFTTDKEYIINIKVFIEGEDGYLDNDKEFVINNIYVETIKSKSDQYYYSLIGSVGNIIYNYDKLSMHKEEELKLFIDYTPYYIPNTNITIDIIGTSCIIENDIIKAIDSGLSTFNITIEANGYNSISYFFEIEVTPDLYVNNNSVIKYFGNEENIELNEKISSISDYAFVNTNIKNINLSNISSIGTGAFMNCASLLNVDLTNVYFISDNAFYGCISITNVNIENINNVAPGAFYGCTKLEIVIGTPGIVNKNAFYNCTSLSQVDLSATTTIGDYAFYNCSSLTNIDITSVASFGKYSFAYTSIRSIEFNNIDLVISEGLFYNSLIENIMFKDNVNYLINDYAFYNTQINELILSNSNFIINHNAFYSSSINIELLEDTIIKTYSSSITSDEVIIFNCEKSNYYTFSNNILFSKDFTNIIFIQASPNIDTFIVPKEVKVISEGMFTNLNIRQLLFEENSLLNLIDDNAFRNCSSIQLVDLSNTNIKKIGTKAFENCSSLREVILSNDIEVIGAYAFSNTSLQNIDLSNTKIGIINNNTFYNCSNLENVNLPNSLEEIKDYAFYSTNLISIDLSNTVVKSLGVHAFSYNYNLRKVILSDETTKINDYCFYLNTSLRNVYGINNVTYFGISSFSYTNLEEIEFKENSIINNNAFSNSNSLNVIKFNYNVTIGEYSFENSNIETVLFSNNSIITLGEYSFYNNKLLKEFDFTKVRSIPDYAFFGCISLEYANLSEIKYVGNYAFEKVPLIDIDLSSAVFIGYNSFSGNKAEFITLSDDVIFISDRAFYNSVNLKEFIINNNDKYFVHNEALYNKTDNGLILMKYPSNKQDKIYSILEQTIYISHSAMINNNYIEEVILPSSLKSIDDFAFANCSNLNHVIFKSKYAPVLRGSYNSDYNYELSDMNDLYLNIVSSNTRYYYSHFKGYLGKENNLEMTYPLDGIGYDSLIYKVYFDNENVSDESNSDLVSKIIYELDTITSITLEDKNKIVYIRSLVDLLNDKEVILLEKYIKKLEVFEKYIEDKELTLLVISKINLIPNNVTIENKELIIEARLLYDTVTNEEELIILSEYLIKLTKAEESLSIKQLTYDTIQLINLIPNKITLEDEDKIIAAREKLNLIVVEEELNLLSDYIDKLEQAEQRLVLKRISFELMVLVDSIPNKVTLEDEELIIEVRKKLNEITDEEELDDLKDYIKKIENYEEQIYLLKNPPSKNLFIIIPLISIFTICSIGIFVIIFKKK